MIINEIKKLDFTSENIFKLNKLIGDNIHKITPTYFSKLCGTTGLLLFLLKDCLEYAGISIVDKKTPIQRIYNNYEYNLETCNSKIQKINNYLTKYHTNSN